MQQRNPVSGHLPPRSGQWSGPHLTYRSAVCITNLSLLLLQSCFPPPRGWNLTPGLCAAFPPRPSAQRIATALHTIVTFTASSSPQMHRAVQQTCAPLSRACCLLGPSAPKIPIARLWARRSQAPHDSLTLPAAKEGDRAGRDAMHYTIGIPET